jgi:hypothetical protein
MHICIHVICASNVHVAPAMMRACTQADKPASSLLTSSEPKKEKDRKWSRDEMDLLHKGLVK